MAFILPIKSATWGIDSGGKGMRFIRLLATCLMVFILAGCGAEESPKTKTVYVPQDSKTRTVACSSVPSCKLDCNQLWPCKLGGADGYYAYCMGERYDCYATQISE